MNDLIYAIIRHTLGLMRSSNSKTRNLTLHCRMSDCYAAICVPLLVQQNVYGSLFFNRSWQEFKVGFNDSIGNYWLGNDLLSQLTQSGRYKLRFDLQSRSNLSWYWAEYSLFIVSSEASNYTLSVSLYTGNAGDAFRVHNRRMFSTYDYDNDSYDDRNCAVIKAGGFWFVGCDWAGVNTAQFRWYTPEMGNFFLRLSRMWLMCK